MPWFVQVLSEHSNAAKLVEVAIGLRLGSRSTSVPSVANFGIQVIGYRMVRAAGGLPAVKPDEVGDVHRGCRTRGRQLGR
jgi:hypothetical protein